MRYLLATALFFAFSLLQGKDTSVKNDGDFTITIQPAFGNQSLQLGTTSYITSSGDTIQIDLFRFYLSGFVFTYENGSVYKPPQRYQLVDAEVSSSLIISFSKMPKGKIVSLTFNIGVDSIKSVSGVHGGDLDPSHGMYWSWNSGYINAKLEGRCNACATHMHTFEFHIGGYAFPNNSLRPVVLPVEDAPKIVVKADAACWFRGIILSKENGIMIPGAKANQMADKYRHMFSIVPNNED